MVFALFWIAVGLVLGAFLWVPVTIRATKDDVNRQVEERVRFLMRFQDHR